MRKVSILFTLVCVTALSGVALQSLTALDARPASANSSYSVPSPAFTPNSDNYDYHNNGALYFNSGSGAFRAPVFLPNGSRFRKIKLLCKDDGASNITVRLFRVNILTNGFSKIGEVSSSGSDAGFRTFGSSDISPRTVNTLKFAYYLKISFPGTTGEGYIVHMVQIRYDAP